MPPASRWKDGQVIASQTVIWTVGVQANIRQHRLTLPRDRRNPRLHVNTHLQVVGHDDIYATGDVAYAATDDKGNHALIMTCQHAIYWASSPETTPQQACWTWRRCRTAVRCTSLVWIWEPGRGIYRRLGPTGETDARRSEEAEAGVDCRLSAS